MSSVLVVTGVRVVTGVHTRIRGLRLRMMRGRMMPMTVFVFAVPAVMLRHGRRARDDQ